MINYNTLIFWWITYTTKYYFLIGHHCDTQHQIRKQTGVGDISNILAS